MAEITDFRLGRIADLRFPAGANFALDFTFSGISLTGKSAKLTARAPGQSVTWSKSGLTVGATTISFNVAPADVDDSSAAFSAFCESGVTDYALTIYDAGGAMSMRLQGTVEWAAPLGDFDAGTANDASISVTVSSGSPVAVSVVSGGGGGSSVLDTDTATSGLSGILKSASDTLANAVAGTDYVAVNDSRLTDARTPTAHKASHATGGTDALTAADIGAATAAQGSLAASAVQPNTTPNFAGLTSSTNEHITLNGSATVRFDNTATVNHTGYPAFGTWAGAPALFAAGAGIRIVFGDPAFFTVPIQFLQRTVATLPSVSVNEGSMIYVSNESGGAVMAFCDGVNWRRVTDRAIVS